MSVASVVPLGVGHRADPDSQDAGRRDRQCRAQERRPGITGRVRPVVEHGEPDPVGDQARHQRDRERDRGDHGGLGCQHHEPTRTRCEGDPDRPGLELAGDEACPEHPGQHLRQRGAAEEAGPADATLHAVGSLELCVSFCITPPKEAPPSHRCHSPSSGASRPGRTTTPITATTQSSPPALCWRRCGYSDPDREPPAGQSD